LKQAGPPLISVVIEGYNESLALGSALNAVDALLEQDFPLNQVELILVGEEREIRRWESLRERASEIVHSFHIAGVDGMHYYDLKNQGAQLARGEILVLLDSDTIAEPGWLEAIVEGFRGGADVQAGITTFVGERGRSPEHPLLVAAAAISWGFIIPSHQADGWPEARGFLSHNVAFRTSVFREIQFRSDLGRTCAGSFLAQALKARNIPIVFNPQQRVAHVFNMKWWLTRLHVRFGYEVFRLRRLDSRLAHSWVRKLSWLEPALVGVWHMLLDIPQWRRTCVARDVPLARQILVFPVLALLSMLARGAEVYGMYATRVNSERMEKFAQSN